MLLWGYVILNFAIREVAKAEVIAMSLGYMVLLWAAREHGILTYIPKYFSCILTNPGGTWDISPDTWLWHLSVFYLMNLDSKGFFPLYKNEYSWNPCSSFIFLIFNVGKTNQKSCLKQTRFSSSFVLMPMDCVVRRRFCITSFVYFLSHSGLPAVNESGRP